MIAVFEVVAGTEAVADTVAAADIVAGAGIEAEAVVVPMCTWLAIFPKRKTVYFAPESAIEKNVIHTISITHILFFLSFNFYLKR